MARRSLPIVGALVLVLLASCGGSTTEPQCRDQTVVLANNADYNARSEALTQAPGALTKNCGTNGRYCYYLSGAPVYTFGDSAVLDGFVGQQVLIVGKIVFPNSTGPGELWPGTICRFN